MKRISGKEENNHGIDKEDQNAEKGNYDLLASSIQSFNDDYKSFISDTESEDELQIILRGHLYIEREITEMLRMSLVEPDEILNSRFMFMNKVNLSIALGILRKDEKSIFKKINSLRNNYAHKLNYVCDEEFVEEIFNSFGDELKKISKNYFQYNNETSLVNKLRKVVGLVWIYVRLEHALLPYKMKMRSAELRGGTCQG